jgi:hypothetical protein
MILVDIENTSKPGVKDYKINFIFQFGRCPPRQALMVWKIGPPAVRERVNMILVEIENTSKPGVKDYKINFIFQFGRCPPRQALMVWKTRIEILMLGTLWTTGK